MISIDIINTQINLRLPEKLLDSVKSYSEKNCYSSIQEFIKETLREKLFDEPKITKKELALVNKLLILSEKKNLYGTEEELFKKLR